MPSTLLFATSIEGRIHILSTGHSVWKEFPYIGLEFKKVSAIQNYMWAIGGDRQVYVHVHGLDIPIRIKEETYENERWFPIEGFGNRMLPTDRPKFSNADGTENRPTDTIQVPSLAWQWEGKWQLESTLNGEPLDHDGWTYAMDFPAKFYPKKTWNSCVRRRKWVRYRRYSALNSWCAIAPLHKDPTHEPFIDVAIGGNAIFDSDEDAMSVWAITAHGRIMYRTGVSRRSPEGHRWSVISTPPSCETLQISVGSTGSVWAVLSNGNAIVRTGIRRDHLTGDNWTEVRAPGDGPLKIRQVSVGTNAVWSVTNDSRVWFRIGIKGEFAETNGEAATGSAWIEMFGNMSHVSVAANDQIFAIGSEDRYLYIRSGVSTTNLTGKSWRRIRCPLQFSRTSSTASLSSKRSDSEYLGQSLRSLDIREKARIETSVTVDHFPANDKITRSSSNILHHSSLQLKNMSPNSLNENKSRYKTRISEQTASSAPITSASEVGHRHFEIHLHHPRAWSPVRSVGSIVGTEAHPESDLAIFDNDSNMGFGDDDQLYSHFWPESDMMWSSCSAGSVTVNPLKIPNWFNDANAIETVNDLSKEWRFKLIEKLNCRFAGFDPRIDKNYEKAIEMSSWIKKGESMIAKIGDDSFEDCLIELEWLASKTSIGTGSLTVLDPDSVTAKLQLSLSDIKCVTCCSDPGNSRLAIHTSRSNVIKFQFPTDTEKEDWLSHLTSICCELNELGGPPAANSIWATTSLGDVFNYDSSNTKQLQFRNETNLYEWEFDVMGAETPYQTPLVNGMVIGSILEITGYIFDDADQVRFDLQCHSLLKVRFNIEKLRRIACHINPRFNERVIVLNTMENSEWLEEIRRDRILFAPGTEFKLVIRCDEHALLIEVDDIGLLQYPHRIAPEAVNGLHVSGRVKLYKMKYYSPNVIVPLRDMFWRQIGGHLRKVESSRCGVVWGIGFDNTLWIYTNSWGGPFIKDVTNDSNGINAITDIHKYYIYENQRWNPLSGYTAHGLENKWSDASGKHKRSKENSKLLNVRWQWISEWLIDFHTPGGVDCDGWQYGIDFSSSYHAKKSFTDYVRRRRWYRKCRLTTTGPWHECGNTKILDVSLQYHRDDIENPIQVWAIALNGDALFRNGVRQDSPAGVSWNHIGTDQPLISIGSSQKYGVWAIGKNGTTYRRCGINAENIGGDAWQIIDSPKGLLLKQISVGSIGVWAVDNLGQVLVRREISSTSLPEGTHWQVLTNVPNDPPHEHDKIGFRTVSVTDEVWAISCSGCVCKRCGVTAENPAGTGWDIGTMVKKYIQ